MDEMDGSDDEFFDACEDINQSKHNSYTPYLKSGLFLLDLSVGSIRFRSQIRVEPLFPFLFFIFIK